MMRALFLATLALLPGLAAAGIEISSDVTYHDGVARSEIKYEDDGSFDERVDSRKTRWQNDSRVQIELNPDAEWRWSARLGHNVRRTRDEKREYREDGTLKNDKSRTEWRQYSYVGMGLRRDLGSLLGGDGWRLRLYHDRFFDVEYSATHLAADARPIAGRGTGYETEVRLQAEYPTTAFSVYVMPRLSIKHQRFSGWTNSARDRLENAEQELQYEARLWLDWITPLDGWELLGGPTWQREDKAERAPEEAWQWHDEEQWLATLRLEYEAPNPGFELELQAEHWLNGADRGDTRYQIELSYEF